MLAAVAAAGAPGQLRDPRRRLPVPGRTARSGRGGCYVGQDAFSGGPFCFDPWTWYAAGALTNPNVLLAGVIGQGKSALAKSLAVRSLPLGPPGLRAGRPQGGVGAGRAPRSAAPSSTSAPA